MIASSDKIKPVEEQEVEKQEITKSTKGLERRVYALLMSLIMWAFLVWILLLLLKKILELFNG